MKRPSLEKISPTVRASSELLGVSSDANPTDLKKAYHKLALIYHPDRNPNASAASEFQKITAAYELLTDPLRVKELNRKAMTERLHAPVIDGLNITFGSFFGYRLFQTAPLSTSLQLDGKKIDSRTSTEPGASTKNTWGPIEENNSVLDHPAFDALEVVYAGKHNADDERAVKGEVDRRQLVLLPWVVLNNQGLLKVLDGDLKKSGECYRQLCERIPNNIIFMYRYGLCLILEGFQKPRRTLLGGLRPDRIKITKGLELLKHCVKIGESRKHGRQKCFVIRKIIADVQEKIGDTRASKKMWRSIAEDDRRSVEAVFRTRGAGEAEKRLLRRRKNEDINAAEGLFLKSSK